MIVTDYNSNQQVMQFSRPVAVGFSDSIEVSAPVGQLIGRIVKQFDLFPSFKVKNHSNEMILSIDGPAFTSSFFGDAEFKVGKHNCMEDITNLN